MASIMQKSFASGELSPSLYSRTDFAKYQSGLKNCRNFIVMRHGGVINRPGTKYIYEVKDSTREVRLIPFIFSQSQSFVLEFGHEYLRFIKNGVPVTMTAQNITAITNANPCVLTYAGSDNYANGNEVYVDGIVGPIGEHLNGRYFKVASVNVGANTFVLQYKDNTNVNSISMGAYTSGGTIAEVYEKTTTYAESDLPFIKYIQSADVVILTHPSYQPQELSRTSDTNWTIAAVSFYTQSPTGIAVAPQGTTGSSVYQYTVTAYNRATSVESRDSGLSGSTSSGNANLSSANFNRVTWNMPDGIYTGFDFNIFRKTNGIWAYVGSSQDVGQFDDIGYSADTTDTPSYEFEDFSAGNCPSCATYYQQRLLFANTNNNTEQVSCSKTGGFYDFAKSNPIQQDDGFTFRPAGRQVNEIYNMVDLGALVLFTESGEFVVQGDGSGVLSPYSINVRQASYSGSNERLAPIVIGNSAVYVQARGNNIRDLNFKYESANYTGNELSIFASHLFDNYQLLDWAYQQIPQSNLWIVRDDGQLLGLTYIKEQEMLAWHRHDFINGIVENVCSIPDANEDAVYLTIKRTVDGRDVRYIEKMATRKISDIFDIAILDSFVMYDGRNDTATTMTLSGSGWTYTDTLTLTASASTFSSSDVGREFFLYDTDGSVIRLTIDAYTSGTVITGRPNRTVPTGLRATSTTYWSIATDTMTNLWHLEGETLSVYADGLVVASPNNPSYTTVTVTNGAITLSEQYSVIYAGLPIVSDIETLNIDQDGGTIVDRKKLISKVTLFVEDSQGIWAGTEEPADGLLDGLTELKIRESEDYDSPISLQTGSVDIITQATWNLNGRVFVRQIDPIPLSILSITPSGYVPFVGGK